MGRGHQRPKQPSVHQSNTIPALGRLGLGAHPGGQTVMRRPEGQRHPLLAASQTLIERLLCAGNRGRGRGGQRRGTGKQESEPSATAAGRTRRLGAQGGVRRLRFSDVGLSSPTPPDPFCFLHARRHERVSFPASSEDTPSCAGCGKGHGKPSEGLPTGPIGSDWWYLFMWFNFSVW